LNSIIDHYLISHSPTYPGIDLWWKNKVIPDIASGTKDYYSVQSPSSMFALCVVDYKQSKLCHLSALHIIRGTETGRALLHIAEKMFYLHGISEYWCHAPESISELIAKWGKMELGTSIGYFGRSGEQDIILHKRIK
jgi:hypothetical protein